MVIIAPPSAMFWSICPEIPNLNSADLNRSGSISDDLALSLAPDQPPGEQGQGDHADRKDEADRLGALLPGEDAQHQPAHPEDRQDGTDQVDLALPGVWHVLDQPAAEQHDRDDDDLEQECDAVRQERGDEAADQRTDGRRDRRRGADQGIRRLLGGTFEVAMDERLHRGQQERRTEAADDRPEDEDRSTLWPNAIARAPIA